MSYTAVVLDEVSREELIRNVFRDKPMPDGWICVAHHMTIGMGSDGKALAGDLLGTTVTIRVVGIGVYEVAAGIGIMAAKVVADNVPSVNAVKHITLCRHKDVKPVMSNQIKAHEYDYALPSGPMDLTGVVQEVKPQPKEAAKA